LREDGTHGAPGGGGTGCVADPVCGVRRRRGEAPLALEGRRALPAPARIAHRSDARASATPHKCGRFPGGRCRFGRRRWRTAPSVHRVGASRVARSCPQLGRELLEAPMSEQILASMYMKTRLRRHACARRGVCAEELPGFCASELCGSVGSGTPIEVRGWEPGPSVSCGTIDPFSRCARAVEGFGAHMLGVSWSACSCLMAKNVGIFSAHALSYQAC
jgi:hypothetical protein